MNPLEFTEYKQYKKWHKYWEGTGTNYRNRHPEFLQFKFPYYFYFKILNDRCAIHWATIREENSKFVIYFIDINGQAFDKLEYTTKKRAQRALRKNKFSFSTNKKCFYKPLNLPVYVQLNTGRKSAPYSKGRLWNFKEKTEKIIVGYMSEGLSINDAVRKMVSEHTELFSSRQRYKILNPRKRQEKYKQKLSSEQHVKNISYNKNQKTISWLDLFWKIILLIILFNVIPRGSKFFN